MGAKRLNSAYWFRHDSNANNDPKCIMMIEQLGLEGYGIYWVLVETLREQPGHKYPLALIPALARRYNTTSDKMSVVVKNYGLFTVFEDEYFYSASLNKRMESFEDIRQKRIESGQKGGLKKAENSRFLANAKQMPSNDVANAKQMSSKHLASRVDKNRKEYIYYGEFSKAKLTQEQYQKLVDKFGERDALDRISKLDSYIASTGKHYADHYATILNWSRKDGVKEVQPKWVV